MKRLLIAALLAMGSLASAQELELLAWDLDSGTYQFPQLCSGVTGAADIKLCPGPGNQINKLVTTSGASSATLTSVNTDAPFAGVSVGDILLLSGTTDATSTLLREPVLRRVAAVATVNSITLGATSPAGAAAVIIPSAGATFVWQRTLSGTGAAGDGWFAMPAKDVNVTISVDQFDGTSMDYQIQCRQCVNAYCTTPQVLAGPTNILLAAVPISARLSVTNEKYAQCRVGMKINTDDGVDTATHIEQISIVVTAAR